MSATRSAEKCVWPGSERKPAPGTLQRPGPHSGASRLLETRINHICDIATYQDLSQDFRHRRLVGGFLGGGVAAIGIVMFAWLANPPERTGNPIALRHANLVGADLSGASLRGVDLTGANLSRAVLRGADLRDAKVEGVTWDSTICPDGTNSDDAHGSCEGHLAP